MEVETKCYAGDQVRDYQAKFNPSYTINFSENMYATLLNITDRIQYANRFRWSNLPNAIDGLDIETMLYSYGSICCFKEDDEIIFSPFTLSGELDIKGNLYNIQPILLNGKTLSNKKRCYNKNMGFDFDEDSCIIIKDYTGCIQKDKIVSRETLNTSTTINDEVKTYKILVYNIMLSIKKMIAMCENEEQRKVVIKQASLLLDPTQPILAMTTGQTITDKIEITQFVDKVEVDDLTRAIDFYNKTRRLNNGIPAPDTFEKKERMITDEVKNAGVYSTLILSDGLQNRLKSVSWINECMNTNIDVEINPDMEV